MPQDETKKEMSASVHTLNDLTLNLKKDQESNAKVENAIVNDNSKKSQIIQETKQYDEI